MFFDKKTDGSCFPGLHMAWIGFVILASSWMRPGRGYADAATQPLIQAGDITYQGAFRIPDSDLIGCDGNTGQHCFSYGGIFGLNPESHSLYMRGHAWAGGVGEVAIPAHLGLAYTASVMQNIYDLSDGIQVDPGETNGQGPEMGFVFNHRLIISGNTFYDADCTQRNTHGISGFDFSVPNDFTGWFPFANGVAANPRSLGGYMANIPPEWQALFGGPALTGSCCKSIISCSSAGPAATVFNPNNVGTINPIPGVTVLFYPLDYPLAEHDTQNNYFNLATQMGGLAFPNGSRSVLFFGRQGTGPYCYGDGDPCGDPVNGYKGAHAYPYYHQVWAYDANDLLAVKNGTKQPYEPRPYAIWHLTEMDNSGGATISGAVFDQTSGLMYISTAFGSEPVVHVYRIVAPGSGGIPNPPRGLQVR